MSGATTEHDWLEQAQALMLRGELARAESVINLALRDYPASFGLRRMLAGACIQSGREAEGRALLTQLLAERPEDAGTAFALAHALASHSKGAAAAGVLHAYFQHALPDTELAIRAIELLDDCGRKRDAAEIAESAMAAAPEDLRLHAYAGMLDSQLGNFPQARAHYLRAIDAPLACEWHVPLGLAHMQRYQDARHSDFALFHDLLVHDDLSGKARSSLLFALAKAHDDIKEYARAADYSREANALARSATKWSHTHWQREIEARLNVAPILERAEPLADFTPIFIVGLPRSGTTLVAELLANFPQVCNRGESPWLATWAERGVPNGQPTHSALQSAAVAYVTRMKRDDAQSARWFIDKQPLNFRYVDLILALFPNARIVHCRRNARDNALSLWMQSFSEDVQGYAYDFSDIALVMNDCERLMAHWRARYPGSIHEAAYERIVASPSRIVADLAGQLGLAAPNTNHPTPAISGEISSASLWQARQPIHAESVDRWKNYIRFLPELLGFAEFGPIKGTDQPDWNSR